MIPNFLLAAKRGEIIALSMPVDDRFDLIYSEDVACAAVAALQIDQCGVFNIASEKMISVADIAEACVRVVGRGSVRHLKNPSDRAPISRFMLDCSLARKRLGFAATTCIDKGLSAMLEHLKTTSGTTQTAPPLKMNDAIT